MDRLTFGFHTITENEVRPGIVPAELPFTYDKEKTIRDAQFDPNDPELRFGILSSTLGNHKPGAFVIYNDFNLQTGTKLAISNELIGENYLRPY